MPPPPFILKKLLIAGVGLIGGSLALALRRAGCIHTCIGIEPTAALGSQALRLGVIDAVVGLDDEQALASSMRGADMLVLAAPMGQNHTLFSAIAPYLEPQTIVTDVGSVKGSVIAQARAVLADKIGQFIPAHPIAGREVSGAAAALVDLYENCRVVLCPLPENESTNCERVRQMWRLAGAHPYDLSAQQHDAIFASVSHLPHVLAFALIEHLLRNDAPGQSLTFAGSGFRDFTRIAASQPQVWRDICIANRTELLENIQGYIAVLNDVHQAIFEEEGATLENIFERASSLRAQWNYK